jgi:glutamate/tyrosine decarboxylase-like PLP-dependent enzyme
MFFTYTEVGGGVFILHSRLSTLESRFSTLKLHLCRNLSALPRIRFLFSPFQYSGGLYVTPTITGTRPGGLMAATWAIMVSTGRQGYLKSVKKLMHATRRIQAG